MCKVQLVTSGSRQAPIGQIITSVQISHLMLRCALVTFMISHSSGITLERLMTLTPQHCLLHTPVDTGDGQDASTPCSLP